jgi:hypothetical protein
MGQNNTGKYFKYAIGEIILVVIGILIALQINNWNQARKSRIQEIKIYKEILSDLNLTLEEVDMDMKSHQKILNKSKVLMEHLIHKNVYNDSIINYLIASSVDLQVYPKTTGFDALNSIGLDLLTNDSVRIEITNLHQLSLDRIINQGWRETPTTDLGLLIDPFLQKHIIPDLEGEQQTLNYEIDSVKIYAPKIRDYQVLLNDNQLIANLNRSIRFRTRKIRRHYNTTQRIQRTIKSIEQELLRLE